MKKLVGILALILLSALNVQAQDDDGFYFMLEGRHFVESIGDKTVWLQHIQQVPGLLSPIGNSDIGLEDIEWNVRGGAGYRKGKWDFGLFYSGLDSSGSDVYTPPENPINNIGGFFPFCGGLDCAGIGGIDYELYEADSSAKYHVVDFETGYNFKWKATNIRLFGGLRYAQFDQNVSLHMLSGDLTGEVKTSHDVDFNGAGLRIGASAKVPLFWKLGITGALSGSTLFGHRANIEKVWDYWNPDGDGGDDPEIRIREIEESGAMISLNADAEIGLTFDYEMRESTLSLVVGYRAEIWNVNDTKSETEGFGYFEVYGDKMANQIFHSPFARITMKF